MMFFFFLFWTAGSCSYIDKSSRLKLTEGGAEYFNSITMKILLDKIKTGNKIKSYRIGKNISLKEASKITGISIQTLTNCENGKSLLNLKNLIIICNFYGKTMDETLSYELI